MLRTQAIAPAGLGARGSTRVLGGIKARTETETCEKGNCERQRHRSAHYHLGSVDGRSQVRIALLEGGHFVAQPAAHRLGVLEPPFELNSAEL